jgi:hypothetical protein
MQDLKDIRYFSDFVRLQRGMSRSRRLFYLPFVYNAALTRHNFEGMRVPLSLEVLSDLHGI